MTRLSEAAKQAIVKKVFANNGQTRSEIARNSNIGLSTLGKWVKRYKNSDTVSENTAYSNKPLSAPERLLHLQATYALDDVALGVYCRKHGFYSHQLPLWKENFMSKNTDSQNQKQTSELKKIQMENKQLKSEILRKDKALAETAALLILKKKAAHIWGDFEDV